MRAAARVPDAPGLLKLTAQQEQLHDWYEARYDLNTLGRLRHRSKPRYLGDRESRRCRYCERGPSEVTFRQKAHAFPELIGNKSLKDYWECDECNATFAKRLDDEFSKWTLPFRSMGRIYGKNGIPKYHSSGLRVEGTPEKLKIYIDPSSPSWVDDRVAKVMTLTLRRQPYIPVAIYKSLVKMAIAVMPDDEGARWPAHRRWLLEKEHSAGPAPLCKVLMQTISGPMPHNEILYFLLIRKPGVRGCPVVVFAVQFGNLILQVCIFRRETEAGDEELFEIGLMPNPWGTVEREARYGPSGVRELDLSGTTQVHDDAERMLFSYEGIKPLTGEELQELHGARAKLWS